MKRKTKIAIVVSSTALAACAVTSVVFQQELRAPFASSANALSGSPSSTQNAGGAGKSYAGSKKRNLGDFNSSNSGTGSSSSSGGSYYVSSTRPHAYAANTYAANSPPHDQGGDTEAYGVFGVNGFVSTVDDPLSTFSVDVDTAAYTIVRRKLQERTLPPADAVRVEELLNFFRYDYPQPEEGPFAVQLDSMPSPFASGKHLLRIGVQGKQLSISERKPAHLTFLVDVSGSMASEDKLPLAKRALRTLVDNLKDGDTVAMVTYASGSHVVLEPTGLERKAQIHDAIESLTADGSTAMGGGLKLAYELAERQLDGKSVSRVIVLSDGDANVGATSPDCILEEIARHVQEGVTLSTVGFGMGNYKDTMMERLADKGNGNYAYVDSLLEARRIFQQQLGGTLEVIAKDVKLQVEFEPRAVRRYRLVGYENRDVADRDFRNDRVDAGEIGAGHSVTALYELELAPGAESSRLAEVRVRAKRPNGERAEEYSFGLTPDRRYLSVESAPADLRFAAAVMGAAELLRRSPYADGWSYSTAVRLACDNTAGRPEREEFCALLVRAARLVSEVAAR